MRRLALFLLAGLGFAGCATGTTIQYTALKGQSAAQLEADRKDCDFEAQKDVNWLLRGAASSVANLDKFRACMKARGYEEKPS